MSQLTFGDNFEGSVSLVEAAATASSPEKKSWYKGRTLSHSSVNLYQQCPLKWKFKYVDRIPELPRPYFAFGKSVHSGLEFLFTKEKASIATLEELLEHYKTHWIKEGYESGMQEKWFFQEGTRILKGFYAKHHHDVKNVFEVELKFEIEVDGVPVMGYIDRIDLLPSGKIAIVDYKTGRAFDKTRVRTDPQLTLYQIACQDILKKEVESVTLYHLNSLTPLTVPPHGADLEKKLREVIVSSAIGIQENKFEAKPDFAGYCQYCDYTQICPAMKGRPKKLGSLGSQVSVDQIDRLGKIKELMQGLEDEQSALTSDLRLQLQREGKTGAEGKYFKVELKASPDNPHEKLDVCRKEKEEIS